MRTIRRSVIAALAAVTLAVPAIAAPTVEQSVTDALTVEQSVTDALTAAVAAGLMPGPLVLVIEDDPGGDVSTFIDWYRRIKQAGIPVVLRGVCDSACGMILMLPHDQVCVESTASIGFHLATAYNKPDTEVTGALIRRWFPESVRRWLSTKTLQRSMIYMDASTLVKLDVFRACGAAPTVTEPPTMEPGAASGDAAEHEDGGVDFRGR